MNGPLFTGAFIENEPDEHGTPLVFVHKYDCMAMDNAEAHDMFNALANAMLVGVVGLFESQRRFELFRDNEFEIMYMNRRVSYFESYEDQKPALNPPFSSVYITSKILPEKVMFTEIDKKAI